LPVSLFDYGFFLAVTWSPEYSTIHIQAALRGVGPRWQPLNVAAATSYWQVASQRASWQAIVVTIAYFYNLDDSGTHPSAVRLVGGSGGMAAWRHGG
jgi:hypothetical protein